MSDTDATTALSDAEMRNLYAMVSDLHAVLVYVKENGPSAVAALESNPMVKMLGIGKMFGV